MRAYAFSGRNKFVFVILSACFAFVLATFVWFYWINVPILATRLAKYDWDCPDMGCFIDYSVRSVGQRVAVSWNGFLMVLASSVWTKD